MHTDYYLNGTAVIMQKTGDNVIWFTYDENGLVTGFLYNGSEYYYIKNAQNDVIGIINAAGTIVAQYSYDAWGKVLSVSNYTASNIGDLNLIRYRGYYYDTETGLYYVASRYYDPEVGRFINADDIGYLGADGSLTGYNLFAYCGNNPVMGYDPAGTFDLWSFIKQGFKKSIDAKIQTCIYVSNPVGTSWAVSLHYHRNIFNKKYTENDLNDKGYNPVTKSEDKFHQNHLAEDGGRNKKYVIGKLFSSEVVFYSDGRINNTPEDKGTFNIYYNSCEKNDLLNFIVHGPFDVVPYMIWGNSVMDSTTIIDRIGVAFK